MVARGIILTLLMVTLNTAAKSGCPDWGYPEKYTGELPKIGNMKRDYDTNGRYNIVNVSADIQLKICHEDADFGVWYDTFDYSEENSNITVEEKGTIVEGVTLTPKIPYDIRNLVFLIDTSPSMRNEPRSTSEKNLDCVADFLETFYEKTQKTGKESFEFSMYRVFGLPENGEKLYKLAGQGEDLTKCARLLRNRDPKITKPNKSPLLGVTEKCHEFCRKYVDRPALIILTDGEDTGSEGKELSPDEITGKIRKLREEPYEKNIPIFIVIFGANQDEERRTGFWPALCYGQGLFLDATESKKSKYEDTVDRLLNELTRKRAQKGEYELKFTSKRPIGVEGEENRDCNVKLTDCTYGYNWEFKTPQPVVYPVKKIPELYKIIIAIISPILICLIIFYIVFLRFPRDRTGNPT